MNQRSFLAGNSIVQGGGSIDETRRPAAQAVNWHGFGNIDRCSQVGRAAREIAKNFELINSLVQQAAIPRCTREPQAASRSGRRLAAAGRDPEARGWYRLAIARDPLDIESQQALFQIDNRDRSRNPTAIRDGESPRG